MDSNDFLESSRRRILGLSAGTLATGLAGCVGDEADEPARETESSDDSAGQTDTEDDTSDSTEPSSPAHEFKSPPYDDIGTQEGPSSTTVSGQIALEEGQYAQYDFELEEPTQVQITGSSKGERAIDLFLLSPEREFNTYQEGESGNFTGGFTETAITHVDRSLEISSGVYFLVFDNSAVYGAEPQGEVSFEFEMRLGEPSPSQPKIREVRDNFGHTFRFSRDPADSVRVDDEIVVSDETVVELCVTDVAKEEDENVTYSYDFLDDSSHPDNPDRATTRIEDNCWRWEMRRTDYQSRWGFRIWIRNDDEIYYQNNSVESDYRIDIYYENLTLAE